MASISRPGLPLGDLLGGQHRDFVGFVKSVLHQADAHDDVGLPDDLAADEEEALGHGVIPGGMSDVGAVLLAQADGHHLHQAALVLPLKSGVGLDAVDHDNAVGLMGVLIDVHIHAPYVADLHRLHGREDGAAHALLGDAVARENAALALIGGAAVTAHGGDQERLGPQLPDQAHDLPGDQLGCWTHRGCRR